MSNKIYPIGIQNFEKIRKGGYCYIDKTAWIYQMEKTGSIIFLSRPRQFWEKLLLNLLWKLIFRGQRTFRRLAIENWKKLIQYPILHLDLNAEKYTILKQLDQVLEMLYGGEEALYGAQDYSIIHSLPAFKIGSYSACL